MQTEALESVSADDPNIAAIAEVAGDESVRAVVLTGSGKAFCCGQDLG